MTGRDIDELTLAHQERLRQVDPLLPVPPIPQLAEGDELIGVDVGGSVAVGVAHCKVLNPDSPDATWGAARRHQLTVRLSGPATPELFDVLLAEWDRYLDDRATPGDDDTAAVINWPSHDTEPVTAFVRHGFAPLVVLAVRQPGRSAPTLPGTGVRIRPAQEADLEVVSELGLGVVEYDAQFGVVTARPRTRAALRSTYADVLAREPDLRGVWLAERSGEPVGMIAVELPPHSDWVGGLISAAPVGYISSLFVRADVRGNGVGCALVAQGHRALEAAGVPVTLLHHALPNPRSTPFWYSQGYRPLWTFWQRRPAIR
jgi:GNAT superfamily N-acetyltransferase